MMNVRAMAAPLYDSSESCIVTDYACPNRFLGTYGTGETKWDVYAVLRSSAVRLWTSDGSDNLWRTLEDMRAEGPNCLHRFSEVATSLEDIAGGILLNCPARPSKREFEEYFAAYPEIYPVGGK